MQLPALPALPRAPHPTTPCRHPTPACHHPAASDLVALLAKHNKPLFAVESKRPLGDFDVLGFSLAYELGATNVL